MNMFLKIFVFVICGFSAWVGKTAVDNSRYIAANTVSIIDAQKDMQTIDSQLAVIDSKLDYLIGFKHGN